MQSSSAGWVRDATASGSTGLPRQRWGWTYTHGVPLLVASIVAVLLSGSGLITVVALGGGGDPPPVAPTGSPTGSAPTEPAPTGSVAPPPTAGPSPTARPIAEGDCPLGRWLVTEFEDVSLTGTWTLLDEGPTFEYYEDGTGGIDYGERTTLQFHSMTGGAPTTQSTSGVRRFDYLVTSDGKVVHTWQDLFGGPTMYGIPYFLNEDTFAYECDGDTMSFDGDDGNIEFVRHDQ